MATIKTDKTLYLAYGTYDEMQALGRDGVEAAKEAMENDESYITVIKIEDGDSLEDLLNNMEESSYAFISQSDYELLNA